MNQIMIRKYPILNVKYELTEELIAKENDIYSNDGINEMAEEDQLSCEEDGFMLGYISA